VKIQLNHAYNNSLAKAFECDPDELCVDLVCDRINAGQDPNTPAGGLRTPPLSLSVRANNLEILRALLNNGADVNLKTRAGITPIMQAAKRGQGYSVDVLLEYGPELEHKDDESNTALMLTISRSHYAIAKKLLSNGAMACAQNHNKDSPFMLACTKYLNYANADGPGSQQICLPARSIFSGVIRLAKDLPQIVENNKETFITQMDNYSRRSAKAAPVDALTVY